MKLATPPFPLAPTPTGQGLTTVPLRGHHAGSSRHRKLVQTNVVPELSDLWTTVILFEGRVRPGLRAWIAGSFHLNMFPRNISPSILPVSFNPPGMPAEVKLYEAVADPTVSGM